MTAGASGGDTSDEVWVEIRFVDFPVDMWQGAREHMDELIREFSLIATDVEHPMEVATGQAFSDAAGTQAGQGVAGQGVAGQGVRGSDVARPNGASPAVPRRLVGLIRALRSRYGSLGGDYERELTLAFEAGVKALPVLVYRMPSHVGQASRELAGMLDEADEYCRSGEHLLTLATPPDLIEFRRWYLGELIRQSEGADPIPWTQWDTAQPDT